MKTKQEQIEEMQKVICDNCKDKYSKKGYVCPWQDRKTKCYNCEKLSEALYDAGYQKAEEVRKETAKDIFQKVVNICIKEEDFQDGTVNTQLEPLYFGIMNGCAFIRGEVKKLAKQYGVEVEE